MWIMWQNQAEYYKYSSMAVVLKKILTWLSSYFGRYFHLRTLSHFIQLKLLNLSWLAWKWMMKKWQKLHYKFSKIQGVKLKKTFLIYDREFYILLCLSSVLYYMGFWKLSFFLLHAITLSCIFWKEVLLQVKQQRDCKDFKMQCFLKNLNEMNISKVVTADMPLMLLQFLSLPFRIT